MNLRTMSQPDLKHSFGKVTISVLATKLLDIPQHKQTAMNQFIRIFFGNEEFESEPQWQSGLQAQFAHQRHELFSNTETAECE